MNFYKEIGKTLLEAIHWVNMVFSAFCDFLNVSEWVVLTTIAGVIVGAFAWRKYH